MFLDLAWGSYKIIILLRATAVWSFPFPFTHSLSLNYVHVVVKDPIPQLDFNDTKPTQGVTGWVVTLQHTFAIIIIYVQLHISHPTGRLSLWCKFERKCTPETNKILILPSLYPSLPIHTGSSQYTRPVLYHRVPCYPL